jgi:hypothetical protein
MWTPELSLNTWFKIYPALKALTPLTCHCGKILDIEPFVSKNFIGIKSDSCSCGRGKKFSGIPRNEHTKISLKSNIYKFL